MRLIHKQRRCREDKEHRHAENRTDGKNKKLTENRPANKLPLRRLVGLVEILAAEDTQPAVVVTDELELSEFLAALVTEVGVTL